MKTNDLISTFLAGDISAYNRLVRRYQEELFNFLLKYTGDRELAADIMQQTFILVYKKLKKLRDRDKFRSWLYSIAVNQCKNYFRKSREINFSTLIENRETTNFDPAEVDYQTANHRPSNDIIKQALQQIPKEQRVVVIMKQYHNLKFKEIASILNEPINTVKARMYYGLTALRKTISAWGINKEDLGYEM